MGSAPHTGEHSHPHTHTQKHFLQRCYNTRRHLASLMVAMEMSLIRWTNWFPFLRGTKRSAAWWVVQLISSWWIRAALLKRQIRWAPLPGCHRASPPAFLCGNRPWVSGAPDGLTTSVLPDDKPHNSFSPLSLSEQQTQSGAEARQHPPSVAGTAGPCLQHAAEPDGPQAGEWQNRQQGWVLFGEGSAPAERNQEDFCFHQSDSFHEVWATLCNGFHHLPTVLTHTHSVSGFRCRTWVQFAAFRWSRREGKCGRYCELQYLFAHFIERQAEKPGVKVGRYFYFILLFFV